MGHLRPSAGAAWIQRPGLNVGGQYRKPNIDPRRWATAELCVVCCSEVGGLGELVWSRGGSKQTWRLTSLENIRLIRDGEN